MPEKDQIIEELKKELQLRHEWVKHHKKCIELSRQREQVSEKQIKLLELRVEQLEGSLVK